MDNTSFKNSIFGGFNRQDVINYIEQSAQKSNETIASLQKENESLQKELASVTGEKEQLLEDVSTLRQNLSDLNKELDALKAERDALTASLSSEKATRESGDTALAKAAESIAALQQELEVTRSQAEEYAKVKDHISGIEFDAKRRADEVEASVRTRLNALLDACQQQYMDVQASAGKVVAHVSAELRKLDVTLSQLPVTFDSTRCELEKLENIIYTAQEKE